MGLVGLCYLMLVVHQIQAARLVSRGTDLGDEAVRRELEAQIPFVSANTPAPEDPGELFWRNWFLLLVFSVIWARAKVGWLGVTALLLGQTALVGALCYGVLLAFASS